MATVPTITTIQKTECIGNSLVTINTNYDNIRNSIVTVNTDILAINNTLNTLTTFANSISSAQLAKAWVKFAPRLQDPNGNEALDISNRFKYNSYNVTTVLREGTGTYLITLANIYGEFAAVGTAAPDVNGNTCILNLNQQTNIDNQCRIITKDLNGSLIDSTLINLVFYSN